MYFMIIAILSLCIVFSKCDYEIAERRSSDDDDPKLFQGYLLKKMMESIPNIIQRWKNFKKEFKLSFSGLENKRKFFTYAKHAIFIDEFKKANTSTFEVEENHLIHYSREEYFNLLGTQVPGDLLVDGAMSQSQEQEIENRQTITSKDWRAAGAVTSVKNQLQCGGCYAFTAIATLESAIYIKTKKLFDLSEQSVIDCSTRYGNIQCDGGALPYTYRYMMDNTVPSEQSYPYTGRYTGYCKKALAVAQKVTSFNTIPSGDEAALTNAILSRGPVGVAIDSRPTSFRFYKSGIYMDSSCSKTSLNHGVTAVGVTNSFYIVKNSWSANWGMSGYVQIARNSGNVCGIASAAAYPIL